MNPWDKGLSITPNVAERAIRDCFPDFHLNTIDFLKAGWDSAAFLINGDTIFRFPKRAEVAEKLRGEIEVLKSLSSRTPIAIPNHCYIGDSNPDFPYLFVGYTLLVGKSQTERRVSLQSDERKRLVKFLNILHSLPINSFQYVSQDDPLQSSAWRDEREKFEERLSSVAEINPNLEKKLRRYFETFNWAVIDEPFVPAIIHNDLLPEHILLGGDDRISAVIDWGDIAIGDPAVDYAGVGYCFGLESLKLTIEESGRLDKSRLLKRARLSIAFAALSDIWYGVRQQDDARISFAIQALNDLLSDEYQPSLELRGCLKSGISRVPID